jgi:DNA invertase Pin-like site-specific DNA recombinase
VALYARQSLTREGSTSLDDQLIQMREAAERLGLTVVAEFVEPPSTSGYKNRGLDRPKFVDLLDFITAGQTDAVMGYKTDRLSRGGGPGWAPLLKAFESAGVNSDRAIFTPDGPLREFELSIRAAMDKEESDKTSDRLVLVRERQAREGRPHSGGRRSYGWVDNTCAEQVPTEVTAIRLMVDELCVGTGLFAIADKLNQAGYTRVSGGKWDPNTVRQTLRNPRLAGYRQHYDTTVQGTWEPIIEPDRWDVVQTILDGRMHKRPRADHGPSLLSGYLFCGRCGHRMIITRREVRGRIERRYACPSRSMGGCGKVRINADRAEAEVAKYVVGTLSDPAFRKSLIEEASTVEHANDGPIRQQLATLAAKEERLLEVWMDGEISREQFRVKKAELTAEQDTLRGLLHRRADRLVELPARMSVAWEKANITERRTFIDIVLEGVTIKPASYGPGIRTTWDPSRMVWRRTDVAAAERSA